MHTHIKKCTHAKLLRLSGKTRSSPPPLPPTERNEVSVLLVLRLMETNKQWTSLRPNAR